MRHFGLVVLLLTLTGSAFAGQPPVEPIAPITTAQEPPLASSSQQEERLEQMLQAMERLQQTLGGQTEQTLSALKTIQKEAQDLKGSIHALEERQENVTKRVDDAKSQVESITDRNLGLINSGFTALGAVAAILALAGIGITYFSTQTYREQIKNKKNAFDRCEAEISQLIEKAKEKVDLLSDEVSRQGLTPNYSKDILSRAQEAVKSGKGIEVLWGKAILAQKNKEWEKAYTFWKTILEDSPRNKNGLFGLALACGNLARESSKNTVEKKQLQEEGIRNLEKISDAMRNPSVLCNWGVLLSDRADAAASPEEKNAFWDDAQEKYRRATEENEDFADAWFNWGTLLSDRAKAAASPEEKNAFWDDAQKKYRRATDENEHFADAWFNWGALLSARAKAVASPEEKNAFWDDAQEKYRRATDENEHHAAAWSNWGNLLSARADAASSPEEKNAFWDDAQKKYRRATDENEHFADAWFNWGALLSARAKAVASPEEKNAFWDDAQEKYRRATEEDEHHAAAWYSWGALLSARADAASSPEEKNALWDEAETKYIQSSSIEPALPAYNQACLAALRNGPLENILHYLNISLKGEELPSLRHMQDDPDLDSIRDTPEFKAFIEKVRALDRPIDKE